MSKKPKSFNKSYNFSYNKKLPVVFTTHAYSRSHTKIIDLDLAEETVKTGRVIDTYKNKVCLERYFGKTNQTYTVIVVFLNKQIRVLTIWKRKGR